MKKLQNLITVKVVRYGPGGATSFHLLETQAGVYLNKLSAQIQEMLGLKKKECELLWLNKGGDTIHLTSQRTFDEFQDAEWCTAPWVLHVHTTPAQKGEKQRKITLDTSAKALFDRYDIDGSGHIDRSELARMLKEIDLEQLGVSDACGVPSNHARHARTPCYATPESMGARSART